MTERDGDGDGGGGGGGDKKPVEPSPCEKLPRGEKQNLLTSHTSADRDVLRLRRKILEIEAKINSLDAEISAIEQQRGEVWSKKTPSVPTFQESKERKPKPPKNGQPKSLKGKIVKWVIEGLDTTQAAKAAADNPGAEYERLSQELERLQLEKANTELELADTHAEHERAVEFLRIVEAEVQRLGCDWTINEWETGMLEG